MTPFFDSQILFDSHTPAHIASHTQQRLLLHHVHHLLRNHHLILNRHFFHFVPSFTLHRHLLEPAVVVAAERDAIYEDLCGRWTW